MMGENGPVARRRYEDRRRKARFPRKRPSACTASSSASSACAMQLSPPRPIQSMRGFDQSGGA